MYDNEYSFPFCTVSRIYKFDRDFFFVNRKQNYEKYDICIVYVVHSIISATASSYKCIEWNVFILTGWNEIYYQLLPELHKDSFPLRTPALRISV